MKTDNRLAIACLLVITIGIAGLFAEQYFDCRWKQRRSDQSCLAHLGIPIRW
jgi:hypothetical protein